METIKNYLENLFAGFPRTSEVENAKSELLNSMEDKYTELKRQGKSENEAIGIVISEFGNIDELMKELNISPVDNNAEDSVSVSREFAEEIIEAKKKNGVAVGIGVFVILLGVILLILVGNLIPGMENNRIDITEASSFDSIMDAITILPLFVCIAIGVAIFIIFGTKMEKYKFLETSNISLSASTRAFVASSKQKFQTTYTIMITLGVILCILSPLMLIVIMAILGETDVISSIAIGVFFLFIATAVFLFIRAGEEMNGYRALLQEEDFSPARKNNNKAMERIGAIYWPIVTAGYLAWSFITMDWHISWIVWPIAGVLYGAVAAIFGGISNSTNTK